jgi:hypothetical protein
MSSCGEEGRHADLGESPKPLGSNEHQISSRHASGVALVSLSASLTFGDQAPILGLEYGSTGAVRRRNARVGTANVS